MRRYEPKWDDLGIDVEKRDAYVNEWIARIIEHQKAVILEKHAIYHRFKEKWDQGVPNIPPSQALFSYLITETSIGTEVSIRCNWHTGTPNDWYHIGDENW